MLAGDKIKFSLLGDYQVIHSVFVFVVRPIKGINKKNLMPLYLWNNKTKTIISLVTCFFL